MEEKNKAGNEEKAVKAKTSGNDSKPKTKKEKIISTVINVVLIAAILLGVFCAYTAFMSSKQVNKVPSIFGLKLFAIQSGSMEPTFNEGDMIIDIGVKVSNTEKNPAGLEVGDIITFPTTINGVNTYNTHRIVEVIDCGNHVQFRTKGDAAPDDADPDYKLVHQNDVVGKYTKIRLFGFGTFIDFLQTKWGFLLIIVLPVAIFFIYQLIQFFKVLFAYQAEKVKLQILESSKAEKTEKEEPKENEEEK